MEMSNKNKRTVKKSQSNDDLKLKASYEEQIHQDIC